MGMLQGCKDAPLLDQVADQVVVQREGAAHKLERDPLMVGFVALRDVDRPHTAMARNANDPIGTNPRTFGGPGVFDGGYQGCHVLGAGVVEKALRAFRSPKPLLDLGAELRSPCANAFQEGCSLLRFQFQHLVEE
jgi:hypothetical protein